MTIIRVNKTEYHDIFIGRPSKFGNPFILGQDGNRTEVIQKFENYIRYHIELNNFLNELDGKIIACWCDLFQICHGDIFIKLINERDYNLKIIDLFEF